MDSPRERWLAALLGGTGTLVAVLALEAVPEMLRRNLELRSNALWFVSMVFGVGALFGGLGHFLFLHVVPGPIVLRALIVGSVMGAAIGLTSWGLTYLGSQTFFPFRPRAGYMRALAGVWRQSLVAGPLGGVAASLAVVRHLRNKTGLREPLAVLSNWRDRS